MKQKLIQTQAKEIFTRTKLPGCDWVINQYVGCEHNCSYCYARFMARWKGYGDWGTWVEAKMNAPELVKNRLISGRVFMSSVSDAYQPIEKELKLTRRILENLDKKTNLSILTKSDLVLRDIDILRNFENAEVGFTINSFAGKEEELFEPDSSTNEERIEAMKILKKNGIKTFAFVSPIIPGLVGSHAMPCHSDRLPAKDEQPSALRLRLEERNPLAKKQRDNRNNFNTKGFLHSSLRDVSRNDNETLLNIIEETRGYADYYWFEVINLRGAGKEFSKILETNYPKSYEIVSNKQSFANRIEEMKKIIADSGVKTKGIEVH